MKAIRTLWLRCAECKEVACVAAPRPALRRFIYFWRTEHSHDGRKETPLNELRLAFEAIDEVFDAWADDPQWVAALLISFVLDGQPDDVAEEVFQSVRQQRLEGLSPMKPFDRRKPVH